MDGEKFRYWWNKARYYRKLYLNWLGVLLNRALRRDRIRVVLRGSGTEGTCTPDCVAKIAYVFTFAPWDPKHLYFKDGRLFYKDFELGDDASWLNAALMDCGFIREGSVYYNPKLGVKFRAVNWAVYTTFCAGEYEADVRGREVVDIGANIGDTPVYFASLGAKHVYAFEPVPNIYQIALEHVKMNGVEDRVTLINGAAGAKDGEMLVPASVDLLQSGVFSASNKGQVKVPVYSMAKIRGMVSDPYLLKMDCEGCEAEIILNSELDFERLVFEAHYNITKVPHKKLLSRLAEQKYRCRSRLWLGYGVEIFECEKGA